MVTRTARRLGQRGFSLLEVLVALLIAGLAMTTALRAAGESMRSTATAERYQEAVSRARSHLEALAVQLSAGEQEGDDGGGFRWRLAVTAVDSTGQRDATGRPIPNPDKLVVTLYAATVWVSWREGRQARSIRLDTARLKTSAPG